MFRKRFEPVTQADCAIMDCFINCGQNPRKPLGSICRETEGVRYGAEGSESWNPPTSEAGEMITGATQSGAEEFHVNVYFQVSRRQSCSFRVARYGAEGWSFQKQHKKKNERKAPF